MRTSTIPGATYGVPQVKIAENWGTICSDGSLGESEAAVLCKQLGAR